MPAHRVRRGGGEKLLSIVVADHRGRLALRLDVEHNVKRHARLHKADLEELRACAREGTVGSEHARRGAPQRSDGRRSGYHTA